MALQNVEANITLDLYEYDTTPTTVKAIQLDSQTRYVAALLQSGGAQYGVDSGATVQLIVIRPDGVGVQITGTTFTYGDEGAQFLGPYAELTQVALAVSGKMRGQFKLTSGTQILRTEIFTISNGVALDASTDEWADEYDGYNLEEMATSIATNTADITALETDVATIKEDFTDISTSIKSELGHRYGDGETTTETQSAYYITGTYGVVKPLGSGNKNYKVERYAVTAGDVYRISGSVYGDTSVYSFYDSNDAPIKWYNDHGGSGFHAVTNAIDIAPSNAVYLYVAHIISKGDALVEKRLNGWTGLKWAMMGDSITDSNNARATKRYFDYISEMTGITTVNLGKSGTGYKKDYNSNLPFYQRVDTIPTDSDVITIFGSGNDCSQTLGTPTDSTADTVCGCINLTIDGIRDRIVGANLGVITPTPWVQYPTTTANNAMDLYCDAIVEICRLKGVPCLDLYHCSNMLPWEEDFRTAFYKHDEGNGVHPDEDGHKLFTPRIKAFLETLLM